MNSSLTNNRVNPGRHRIPTESKVRVFKPGRGRWIFSERKNPEYDFLQKGSKAVPHHRFTTRKKLSSEN